VLFSTHILSDLERVAFDVAFLSEGRIALQAPLDELLDNARRLVGSAAEVEALCRRLALRPVSRHAIEGGRVKLIVQPQPGMPWPEGIDAERVTLEDLFLELTQ
jgi:ABC-2 type transport system ATP-binding protein